MKQTSITSMPAGLDSRSGRRAPTTNPQAVVPRMSSDKRDHIMTVAEMFTRWKCLLLRWNALLSESKRSFGSKQRP